MNEYTEKRKHPRKIITVNVDLLIWSLDGEKITPSKTKDISLGGAFLLTDNLKESKVVPIDMRLKNNPEAIQNPIYLQTIRKTNTGTAVEFRSYGINEFAALQQILG